MKIITQIVSYIITLFYLLVVAVIFKIPPGRGKPAANLFFYAALLVVTGIVTFFISKLLFNKSITAKKKLLYIAVPAVGLFICAALTTSSGAAAFGGIATLALGIGFWYVMFKGIDAGVSSWGDKKLKEHFKREEIIRGCKTWVTREQLVSAAGQAPNGLNIGASIRWGGQGHVLTVGGTRGGKGVNLVIPALLDDGLRLPDAPSFVVLDPKGENLAITGNYLKRSGYKVFAVNPFAIPEIAQFGNARFNPFDLFTGNDPDFDKFADMIAYALVPEAMPSP